MTRASRGGREPAQFPFLGQGDASYYEWFEMWIWFAKPVSAKQRAALLDGGPPPAIEDAQWPSPDVLWASNGDQWIQRHIKTAYGRSKAEAKFNAAIEAWLRAMHATHPILFAVRRADLEAGGTKLGAWHAASVEPFIAEVAPVLAKLKLGKRDLRRTPLTLAANYVGPSRVAALKKLADKDALVDDSDEAKLAEAEDDARSAMSEAFCAKKFAAAGKLAAQQRSPGGAFRALSSLTDDVFCMGVDLGATGAHKLVVAMVERGLGGKPLSTWRDHFVKRARSMSIHQVSVAYAGALQAAAWAEDKRTFDAVVRLIDDSNSSVRGYCARGADALESKRPAFAKRLRALAAG